VVDASGAIDRGKLRQAIFGDGSSCLDGGSSSDSGGSSGASSENDDPGARAAANKAALEAIVWPKIRAAIEDRLAALHAAAAPAAPALGDPPPLPAAGKPGAGMPGRANMTESAAVSVVVVEAALLLEAKWEDLCDEVWLVGLPDADAALERLLRRDPHLIASEPRGEGKGGKEGEGGAASKSMAALRARCEAGQRLRRAALAKGLVDRELDNGGSAGDLALQVDAAWEALGFL
jgi:hypothetical protein